MIKFLKHLLFAKLDDERKNNIRAIIKSIESTSHASNMGLKRLEKKLKTNSPNIIRAMEIGRNECLHDIYEYYIEQAKKEKMQWLVEKLIVYQKQIEHVNGQHEEFLIDTVEHK
jgi:hypothetical protein